MKTFTHEWVDLDGLIAIEIRRRFGVEKLGIETGTIYWGGELDPIPQQEVVFVDICPKGFITDPAKKIFVFDHHPHSAHPWKPESKNPWEHWHTATSKIIEFLGLNLNDPKIAELARWAYRGDFKSGGDQMNIVNLVKEIHLLYPNEAVSRWVSMIIESHLKTAEKISTGEIQKGIEFFKNILEEFLSENKESPAKKILQKWLERAEKATEDRMNIVYQTAANLAIFGPEETKEWLIKVLNAIQEDQQLFWAAEKDFEISEKVLLGRWVVVFGESINPRFNRFCRSAIAKTKMPKPLNAREDPIVVQFWPENKGFQVYTNKSGYKLFDIVGGLRTEILKTRKQKIPPDWRTLKAEGTLPGTEPLYYQQGDYEVIMWGSLTTPRVRPMDIPRELVKRIVSIAVDQNYWPQECQKSKECLRHKCGVYPWMLWRCYKKRQQNRKPSSLNA